MKIDIKKVTAAALAVLACSPLLTVSTPATAAAKVPYTDIATSYAKDEIAELYESDIMKGTTETLFSPKKAITRAEFVTVLGRLFHLDPVDAAYSPFKDVKSTAWYYEAVMAASQLELVAGTNASSFAPAKPITRQEAAVLLVRALKQEADASEKELAGVTDKNAIAGWAEDAVAKAYQLELMQGDSSGKFRPGDAITREEAAVMITRILDNKKWSKELDNVSDESIQLGWQYAQTTAQFKQTVSSSTVNTLSPRWYFIGEQGKVSDGTEQSLIAWAEKNDKQIWAMVGNRSDQELTHDVLSNETARTAAVNNLTALVTKYKLDGLNIDFENVGAADRKAMTAFVEELASQLDEAGAILSFNVSPDRGTDWTEAFDYEAIGDSADYVVLMCYDEHWGGSSTAGSVSSLDYVSSSLKTLVKEVPEDKVILALPFYTRDWTLNANGSAASSVSVSLQSQQQLITANKAQIAWDAEQGQYVADYTKNGLKHRVWMEDGRSMSRKLQAAASYDLAGYAYWYMGSESTDMWSSIRNANTFYQYDFE